MEFEGKVALITGAGGAGPGGLGVDYAHALAAEGAAIVVTDIDGEAAARVAASLTGKGYRAIGVKMDVTDEPSVIAGVEEAIRSFGGVDILINNAGLCRGKWSGGLALSAEDWNLIFAVNAVAPLVCARACRETMKARGGGVVINASSCASYAEFGAYSVTKLALNGINNILANELGVDNIRVNAIAPGLMHGRVSAEDVASVLGQQKLKRRGDPKDLIGGLLYLCSDRSSFVTGTVLRIDGGFVRAHT